MKGGREHRVPLSSAAIALLESTLLVDGDDVIFQSTQGGGGAVSNMTMLKVCQRMGEDCVPHGFRSTFRDWCAECTDVAPEVAEMALAHQVGNSVEAAYRRGDLLDKRRSLMEAWSTFLTTGTNPSQASAPSLDPRARAWRPINSRTGRRLRPMQYFARTRGDTRWGAAVEITCRSLGLPRPFLSLAFYRGFASSATCRPSRFAGAPSISTGP